jgi:hypothetical protein
MPVSQDTPDIGLLFDLPLDPSRSSPVTHVETASSHPSAVMAPAQLNDSNLLSSCRLGAPEESETRYHRSRFGMY